jgi:hypothetical protein
LRNGLVLGCITKSGRLDIHYIYVNDLVELKIEGLLLFKDSDMPVSMLVLDSKNMFEI